MSGAIDALLDQLLEWIGDGRPYAEAMSAWRTSCPRMPVWEEATERGLVRRSCEARSEMVYLTERGRARVAAASPTIELRSLAVARRFAAALDAEAYDAADDCLHAACVYSIRGEQLVGPGAIVASYRRNGEAARAFDSIEYGSDVREGESAGWAVIGFWDRIVHRGREHTHRCEQWVRVEGEGVGARIVRIEHRDLPGEREALEQFKLWAKRGEGGG